MYNIIKSTINLLSLTILFSLNEIFAQSVHTDKEYILDSGERYFGYILNGIPEGKGRIIYSNGERFEGYFKSGERYGRGKYYYNDSTVYDGEWIEDQPEGNGVMYFADGSLYGGH